VLNRPYTLRGGAGNEKSDFYLPCFAIPHTRASAFFTRAESQFLETERFGAELAKTISDDFMTATDINYVMGRLFTAVAQDRIPIRNANALARIGRILLNTIPGIKSEFPFSYKFEE
jgi:hypothetical protein